MNMVDELERLAALRSGNMLTQDEFESAKRHVLAGDRRRMRRRLDAFAHGTPRRASRIDIFMVPLVVMAAVLFASAFLYNATRSEADLKTCTLSSAR